MLKVVGASPLQTRLTFLALFTVTALAILVIVFYEVPLNSEEDGVYTATAFWSPELGFRFQYWGQSNNLNKVEKGIARIHYKPDTHKTGWARVEIESSEDYPDWAQAYAAGVLEGSLTWQAIYWQWKNTVEARCIQAEEECDKLRQGLTTAEMEAKRAAQVHHLIDPFWHHVNLFYTQLDGLEDGWQNGILRSGNKKLEIPHIDFLWMNSAADLQDIEASWSTPGPAQPFSLSLMRYLPNATQCYLLTHQTGASYSGMLRMQKKYTLRYHRTGSNDSSLVPGVTVVFTSYPAAIHSQDDFYQIRGGTQLTVSGSSIRNYNSSLWEMMDFNKVMTGPRVMAANRLSAFAGQWNAYVGYWSSGTGAKQWFVVDTGGPALSLWLVEQGPGVSYGADVTDSLIEQGYWVSVGVPYLQETRDALGYSVNDTRAHAPWSTDMLALLEERILDCSSSEDLLGMLSLPQLMSLSRGDLVHYEPLSGKSQGPRPSGAIDVKIAEGNNNFLALAGPPHSAEVSPFQWSQSILRSVPHVGQPDLWNFAPVTPTWAW